MTHTWAAEFAESNVRVNAVAPGPMHTSRWSRRWARTWAAWAWPPHSSAHPTRPRWPTSSPFSRRRPGQYTTEEIAAADGGRTAI
ncbi:SDR family oxidoreductase [Streptomyces sp. NPDC039022]|uniref:SDR family oxidoreductase n=1 Tax=Streptomyces sp. NPDC039022 TaxID=3157091 RepID=UPI0033D7FF66